MIEDFRIKVFEAVAKNGSFTAAAREIGVSQPAVSQNVTELEKQLGVKLFNRSRSEVSLTEDGDKFRRYARQILHWYEAANQAFSPDGEEPKAAVMQIGDERKAFVWSVDGDIHITLAD